MRPIQETPVPPFENVTDVITVIFEVTDAETRYGESLRVVGGCAELGCWAPEEAICLTTSPDAFPVWRSTEVKFPILRQDAKYPGSEDVVVEYKYIRDANKLGQGFRWEERIADRKVHLVPVQGGIWKIKDPAFNVMGAPTLTPVFGSTKTTCNAGEAAARRAAAPQCAAGPRPRDATPECTPEPEAQDTPKFADAYRVLGSEALGSGGFSSVWRCCRRKGGEGGEGGGEEELAVKRIETGKLTKRGWRFLFGHRGSVGEIEIHGSVEHPNVVALREVFQEVGTVSIVMECCHGGDLLEIVHGHNRQFSRGLPEVAAGSAVRQLLRALSYLHDMQILHRDVKCENIFHKEPLGALPLELATFKLGDFGLAARIAPEEVLLEPVGSPSTSAPEVVCGRPYAKPADVWSAGVAAFITVAAQRPFEASTSREMVERATRGQISLKGSPWDELSAHAHSFVKDLLRPQATQRPTVQTALAHPWLQW